LPILLPSSSKLRSPPGTVSSAPRPPSVTAVRSASQRSRAISPPPLP
jgi:hypothetical protein